MATTTRNLKAQTITIESVVLGFNDGKRSLGIPLIPGQSAKGNRYFRMRDASNMGSLTVSDIHSAPSKLAVIVKLSNGKVEKAGMLESIPHATKEGVTYSGSVTLPNGQTFHASQSFRCCATPKGWTFYAYAHAVLAEWTPKANAGAVTGALDLESLLS